MESKSPISYIGIGITIGVVLTVILIYVFGIQPSSINIGLVDFSLPATEEIIKENTESNSISPNSNTLNTNLPTCNTGNSTGIAGQLITELGEPISYVVITSNPPTQSVITDINGYYLICNIPAESSGRQYTVFAQKSGYIDTLLTVTAMPSVTAIANIVLKVTP